jgi:hypothetical protein
MESSSSLKPKSFSRRFSLSAAAMLVMPFLHKKRFFYICRTVIVLRIRTKTDPDPNKDGVKSR